MLTALLLLPSECHVALNVICNQIELQCVIVVFTYV